MQVLSNATGIASAGSPGAVRDAGNVKSRVMGIVLDAQLLEHLPQPEIDSGHARDLLTIIAKWFVKSTFFRSNKGSINLLIQQWGGEVGGTNEAPSHTEEIYVSLGISYYLTKDWEIVRQLDCIAITANVFDQLMKLFGIQIPADMDCLASTNQTHKALSSMLEDVLNASSRQNLTAAICLLSLVIGKQDNMPTICFVPPVQATRIMTAYIDHSSELLGLPINSVDIPSYTNDPTHGSGNPSDVLRRFFDESSFLKPDGRFREFEDTILVIGEFPDASLSQISFCLFDFIPSRSSARDRPSQMIDRQALRFKPLLDQLEAIETLPFTILQREESVPNTPSRLELPRHLGRGFRLDGENIEVPGLPATVNSTSTITVAIALTRWISQVRSQGLTTSILHTVPGTQNMVSSAPQPTLIEPFTTAQESIHQPTDIIIYESITCMPHYLSWSFEELRLADYNIGVRRSDRLPTARLLQANAAEGTVAVPFAAFEESFRNPPELAGAQGIAAVPYFRAYSYEELRVADYAQGRRWIVE